MAAALLKHCVYMDSQISARMSVILPALLFSPVFIMSVTEQIKKKKAQRSLTLPASGLLAYFTRCWKSMACKLPSGHSLMMSYILTVHTFISSQAYTAKKEMVENKGKRACSCGGLIRIQMDDLSPNGAITEPKPFLALRVLPSCGSRHILEPLWYSGNWDSQRQYRGSAEERNVLSFDPHV